MFEHLDYEVVKLDRVVYANLTKKTFRADVGDILMKRKLYN
ncbi:hypothetical protein [Mucilaginibacter antarcticus]